MSNLSFSKNHFQRLLRSNKELQVAHEVNNLPLAVQRELDPCIIDGLRFDSELEAKRYSVLKLWLRAGLITDLDTQHSDIGKPQSERKHRWILVDAYTTHSGVKKLPVYYIDDFIYKIKGITIVEDYKGFERAAFKNKRKAFEERYPDVNFFVNFALDGWYPTHNPERWRKLNA